MQAPSLSASQLLQNAFTDGLNDYIEYQKAEEAKKQKAEDDDDTANIIT